MSRIGDLIRELCPHGVEFQALGEIGKLVRGNGMPKSDFVDSGVGCIHYGQIYTYYRTWTTTTISFVPPEKAAKLAKVDPGDLIITNTSENLEDVCKTVAWLGDEQIVTGAKRIAVIENGVDLARFNPSASEPEKGRLLFIGSLAHLPNLMRSPGSSKKYGQA